MSSVQEKEAMEEHRARVIGAIRTMYDDGSSYGELSQMVHALQTAKQAEMAGAPEAIVVGALLHDVGWKLCGLASERTCGADIISSVDEPPPGDSIAAEMGILEFCGSTHETADAAAEMKPEQLRAQHDVVGSVWARMQGFDASVCDVIEGHVLAKRYLTFKEPDYFDKLSPGSKRTLEFQGGPMSEDEARIFESVPNYATFIESRRWDEGAKEPCWEVPRLDYYLPMVARAIVRPPTSDTATIKARSTIVRDGNRIIGFNGASPDGADDAKAAAWRCPVAPFPALRSPRQTELLAQWADRGYVVLRRHEWLGDSQGARAEHIAEMCEAVEKLPQAAPGFAYGPFHSYEQTPDAVRPSRTEAFVDHAPEMDAFLRGPTSPVVRVVSHLAGEPAQLYKEKINYKYPGGGGYIAHQDYYHDFPFTKKYTSAEDRGFITYVCMIAVDDSTVENGCACVAPETWKRKEGWLKQVRTDADGGYEEGSFDGTMGPFTPVELEAGDLLIYDNYMPHNSRPNTSSKRRRALFGIYYGSSSSPVDLRKHYYEREAAGRRHRTGTGKANELHTGKPIKFDVHGNTIKVV